jgi:hypothetical protein
MSTSRQHKILLAISALVMLLLLTLFAWISTTSRERMKPSIVEAPASVESDGAPAPEVTAPAGTDAASTERMEIARPAAGKPKEARKDSNPAAPTSGGVTLIATFSKPDGTELELPSGFVELRDAKGTSKRVEIHDQNNVQFDELAPSVYVARVTAPNFEHRDQFLDFTGADDAYTKKNRGEAVFEKKLVCWPADWIQVIVEATDGRPLSALAKDLGYEPRRLFVDAFQVHTQLATPRGASTQSSADALETQRGESALARFHAPPDYKSFEITKSCVGSLELLHAPPMWVELGMFGKPIGWESLQIGAREVVFRIDRKALDDRLARLTARVVDVKSHNPVSNALVTLRADISAHRRSDLGKQPTGNDGRIELTHIVPGRYEFTVVRGETQHQEMISLAAGEQRDMGDIALADGQGIDVFVADETGRPMQAWLEIGPYRKEVRSSEIYPASIGNGTGPDGRGRLPMPSDAAIVRAAIEPGRSTGPRSSQEIRGMRTANVLLDPRSPPTGPLKLTIRQPVKVKLVTHRTDDLRIEIEDEIDVLVARSTNDTDKHLDAELVPGRYRARLVTPLGEQRSEVPFVADGTQAEIAVD